MLIARRFRIDIQADPGSPPEKRAGKDDPKKHGAEDQQTRQAERADQEIREPGSVVLRRVSDVDDDGR